MAVLVRGALPQVISVSLQHVVTRLQNIGSVFYDSHLKHLLVVSIHEELQTVALFIPMQPKVDRIAAGHAIFVELLIPLAGIQLDPGMVAAVGADDALAGVLDHDNLLGPAGRLSPLILAAQARANREQAHVYEGGMTGIKPGSEKGISKRFRGKNGPNVGL